MSDRWFILRNGKQHGPFVGHQLKQLANSGKLKATDLVLQEGAAKPVAANQVPGIFGPVQVAIPAEPVVQRSLPSKKKDALAELRLKLYQVCWSSTKRRIFTCVGVLMLIGVVTGDKKPLSGGSSTSISQPQPLSHSSGGTSVSAIELIAAYTANELAGDKKFKNKTLIVSGSVREVGTEKVFLGQSTFVELYGRDKFDSPRVKCYLPSAQKDRAADLSPGTRTTVEGYCEGLKYGRIVLKDCRFVDKLNLSVGEFIQRARGKSFSYAQFVEQFGLPSSESTPAPISDDLFLYFDLKDGSVMVSLWKQSWYKRENLLIHDVTRVP